MLAHSQDFKEAITRLGRDINVLIDYYAVTYNLETEDDKLIITQDNLELLTEEVETQEPTSQLTNDDIISLNKNNYGELFRTYMKSFDLETTHRFNVGDKMIIKVGTTVDESVEYINYGIYYVYQRKYNEDTQTYTYTLCDRMLFTMQKYDNEIAYDTYNGKSCYALIYDMLTRLCGFDRHDITLNIRTMVNYIKIIYKDTFNGVDMTCRDVLDMIMQVNGCSLVIEYDEQTKKDYITTKTISNESIETIDGDILKDSNIKIGKLYGKVNSLLFSRSDETDNIERKDDASIEENGKTQYVIKDNLILNQENRVDFIDNLFNVINGLEYYTCDIDTIGLGYIEYLDRFTINANSNLYNTICLKDTSDISNGMSETFTTEELTGTAQTFENIGYDDKKASITMDKLKGEIVLKTYEEDGKTKIAQVRLDSSGEDGSLIEMDADQIDFNSHTFNLTTDSMKIESDNFSVQSDGTMNCSKANITGGLINITSTDNSIPSVWVKGTGGYSNSYSNIYPYEIEVKDSSNHTTIDTDRIYISPANSASPYGKLGKNVVEGGTATKYFYLSNESLIIGQSGSAYLEGSIRGTDPYLRLYKSGSAYCTYKADGQHPVSDRRCKDNINDIDKKQSLNIITNLQPVEYNYIELEDKHRGLIAQDVKEVLNKNGIKNEIYGYDEKEDRYNLNYTELIPDLINCIKYQQEQIEELKEEINKLKEVK